MEQVRMLRCGLCNNRADVNNMKYHKSGEYLICKDCYDKQATAVKPKPADETAFRKPESAKDGKVGYRCRGCGYSFTRAKDHTVRVCPYCGKDTVSLVQSSAAQNIIDNAAY